MDPTTGNATSLFSLVVAVIALVGVALSAWLTFWSSQKSVAVESIRVLGDPASATYAKMLALATMLEKKLLPADSLLDAAYAAEATHGQRVTLQLLYLVGRGKGCIPESPVGYVDRPEGNVVTRSADGAYYLSGWAIDDTSVVSVQLWIDGALSAVQRAPGPKRPDIASLFKRFGKTNDLLSSGFLLGPIPAAAGETKRLCVRVYDKEHHFREILCREMHFQ